MIVPHIKDRYLDGNPGYKPRYGPGIGPRELGEYITYTILYVALTWLIISKIL